MIRKLSALMVLLAAIAPAAAQGRPSPFVGEDVGETVTGDGTPSDDDGAWPHFRGPGRDATVPAAEAQGLLRQWPEGGPRVLWEIDGLYMGYSGAAVHGGRVFFHDYDDQGPRWMVRCVSLADGAEIWRWSYRRKIRRNHAVTRTVPATDGTHVVSLDPKAMLHGLDAATGKRLWAIDLPARYGARIPPWYNGQCPLIDDGRAVIGVGGRETLMIAVDPATGTVLWETPNKARHPLSHSSVMPAVIGGRRQYVWCTLSGFVGVAADDGSILWEVLWRPRGGAASAIEDYAAGAPHVTIVDWRTNTAVAPSPVVLEDGRIFMTAGYKAGCVMFRVKRTADGGSVAEVDYTIPHGRFNADCQTPVVRDGHLFAVDHAVDGKGRFACLSLDGTVAWRHEGQTFGLGNWLLVGDVLFAMDGDTGTLHMIEATPDGYTSLGRASVLDGHEVWAPMAYVNGKLICRDMDTMVCLEVARP
ncbi:MAG: PQQ-binding-like beta-propeller repeat protein [Planctomycetota bacterium]